MSPTTIQHEPQSLSATNVSIRFQTLSVVEQQHLSADYWRWLELFQNDPEARITQHPDYLFAEVTACLDRPRNDSPRTNSRASQTAQPLVVCRATQGQQLVALGVLVPKLMTTRQAGGFGLRKTFEGYRLAGNRFLGIPNTELQREMLSACMTFAHEQHATYLLIEDLERDAPLFAAAESLQRDGIQFYCPRGIQERLTIEFPSPSEKYWPPKTRRKDAKKVAR